MWTYICFVSQSYVHGMYVIMEWDVWPDNQTEVTIVLEIECEIYSVGIQSYKKSGMPNCKNNIIDPRLVDPPQDCNHFHIDISCVGVVDRLSQLV